MKHSTWELGNDASDMGPTYGQPLTPLVEGAKRKHAFCSASGSKRWMKCHASPGFIERNRHLLPEDTDSEYSREGTLAHDLAARCLLLGYDKSWFEDKDMARYVKGYVELVNGWVLEPGWELFVEQEVPLFYHPDETGFLDAGAVKLDGTAIRIGDLKYGSGNSIWAKENPQLAIYGLSLIESLSALFNFTDETLVTLLIHQPRIEGEPANRLWVLRLKDLRAFCAKIGETGRWIYANPNNDKFSPDDETCKWCDAVAICGARAAQLFGDLPEETATQIHHAPTPNAPVAWPVPEALSVEQLARIVAIAPDFKEWLGKCQATAAHRLHEGLPFPGWKLVEGRSNRKWRDDAEALELLTHRCFSVPVEEYTTTKLISPAQAQEKLSKADWDFIKHLVVKPPGAPTLVPESHEKPALVVNPAEIFPNLEQDTDSLSLLS